MQRWALVVEDDQAIQAFITDALEAEGMRTLVCDNATEALRKMKIQKFAFILLDINLNGPSGETVITQLREDTRSMNHHTPIIVMSGNLDADLVTKIRGNVNGGLVKPFDHPTFIEKLSSLSLLQRKTE